MFTVAWQHRQLLEYASLIGCCGPDQKVSIIQILNREYQNSFDFIGATMSLSGS